MGDSPRHCTVGRATTNEKDESGGLDYVVGVVTVLPVSSCNRVAITPDLLREATVPRQVVEIAQKRLSERSLARVLARTRDNQLTREIGEINAQILLPPPAPSVADANECPGLQSQLWSRRGVALSAGNCREARRHCRAAIVAWHALARALPIGACVQESSGKHHRQASATQTDWPAAAVNRRST